MCVRVRVCACDVLDVSFGDAHESEEAHARLRQHLILLQRKTRDVIDSAAAAQCHAIFEAKCDPFPPTRNLVVPKADGCFASSVVVSKRDRRSVGVCAYVRICARLCAYVCVRVRVLCARACVCVVCVCMRADPVLGDGDGGRRDRHRHEDPLLGRHARVRLLHRAVQDIHA